MKSCACPLRVEFLFLSDLWNSFDQILLFSKARYSEDSSFWSRPPAWAAWCGCWKFNPVGEPLWYSYFLVCVSPTWQMWGLTLLWLHLYYLLIVAFSLSLDTEYIYIDSSVLVFFSVIVQQFFVVLVFWWEGDNSSPSTLPSCLYLPKHHFSNSCFLFSW